MGNCPSSLRAAILNNDIVEVETILKDAGVSADDVINQDYAQDCILDALKKAPGNALYYAVYHNRLEIVKMMLSKGADVHCTGMYGETCLHCAGRYNFVTMGKLLVQAGCDAMATDDHGHYVIHACAMSGHNTSDFLQWYMGSVISKDTVNLPDFFGRTALHEAVAKGNLEVCHTLVAFGANVNAVSLRGDTPLHEAGARVRPSIWDILVRYGADTQAENDRGIKPFQEALQRRRDSI